MFNIFLFTSLFLITCQGQGIVTQETIVAGEHFIVEIYDDDYEWATYTCEDDFGGKLSSIRSQDEQNEINTLIQRVDFSDHNIWIGYTNNGGSTYSWDDSSTSTYTNWCANEPSGSGERCAQLTSAGCWISAPCGDYHYGLCRRGNVLYSSNSNYVVVQDSALVYLDAQAFCRDSIGTELATVETTCEQDELLALIRSANHFEDEFYIGLDDRSNEGTIAWQDSTSIDNSFINSNLCNTNNNNQDCVYVNENEGCWRFHACNFFFHFACNSLSRGSGHAFGTRESANYIAVDASLSFSDANEFCKNEFCTTVATITSASENSEVAGISYRTSWIGYNDIDSEGNFVWLSGSGTYTNWRASTNEPNAFTPAEDCTIIYRDQNICPGCWNDLNCADPRAFVCNKS